MTRQRRALLDAIGKDMTHPTADEVHRLVRRLLPRISLGTVYRNLDALAAAGLIQKVDLAGTQRRFDPLPEQHYHVRCTACGSVSDVTLAQMGFLHSAVRGKTDYTVTGHRLEFLGLCPRCSADARRQKSTLKGETAKNA